MKISTFLFVVVSALTVQPCPCQEFKHTNGTRSQHNVAQPRHQTAGLEVAGGIRAENSRALERRSNNQPASQVGSSGEASRQSSSDGDMTSGLAQLVSGPSDRSRQESTSERGARPGPVRVRRRRENVQGRRRARQPALEPGPAEMRRWWPRVLRTPFRAAVAGAVVGLGAALWRNPHMLHQVGHRAAYEAGRFEHSMYREAAVRRADQRHRRILVITYHLPFYDELGHYIGKVGEALRQRERLDYPRYPGELVGTPMPERHVKLQEKLDEHMRMAQSIDRWPRTMRQPRGTEEKQELRRTKSAPGNLRRPNAHQAESSERQDIKDGSTDVPPQLAKRATLDSVTPSVHRRSEDPLTNPVPTGRRSPPPDEDHLPPPESNNPTRYRRTSARTPWYRQRRLLAPILGGLAAGWGGAYLHNPQRTVLNTLRLAGPAAPYLQHRYERNQFVAVQDHLVTQFYHPHEYNLRIRDPATGALLGTLREEMKKRSWERFGDYPSRIVPMGRPMTVEEMRLKRQRQAVELQKGKGNVIDDIWQHQAELERKHGGKEKEKNG